MATNDCIELPPLTVKNIARFWAKIDRSGGPEACWPWKGFTYQGYGQTTLYAVKRTYRAHRLAYFLGHGVDPSPLFVCHKCDNPPCCNPAHLFLGTNSDNIRDAYAKGRLAPAPKSPEAVLRGEQIGTSKLTEADVLEIRRMYATGLYIQPEIAARFGIKRSMVGLIVHRKKWKHIVP